MKNNQLIKGMDLSVLAEVETCGGKFYDHGVQKNAMEILAGYGMNMVRLRLWNNPYDTQGKSYGAGTCDLPCVMGLARRAKMLGILWMLDIHYSDFWADPQKQFPPKAWAGKTMDEMVQAVEDYTFSVLTVLKESGLLPSVVAVGNEITNGFLWPLGKFSHSENMVRLINAGIDGVKRVEKELPIMIHLDNGGNNALYRLWFDTYFAAGGKDFTYIGLSYYPFWSGTLNDLYHNMNDLADRYQKDMIIAEVSTAFTQEDYQQYEQLPVKKRKGMAAKPEAAKHMPYPMTPEGQSCFMQDLIELLHKVKGNRAKGFIYWGAEWIPVPGSEWAKEEAINYMNEKGPGGNEWANQALFDYEGNTLPALNVIRDA